jgi:exopolysaccharide biosynthesis polyprenyl glycosylphosphotransferase
MKKADFVFNILRAPVDFGALVGAGIATYALRIRVLDAWRPVQFSVELPFAQFAPILLIVAGMFVLVYALAGLYAMRMRISRAQEAARIIVASSGAMMLVLLVIFLRAELFNSRFLVVGFWAVAMLCVISGRLMLRALFGALLVHWRVGMSRVLLIGNDAMTQDLARTMENPANGLSVVRTMVEPELATIEALAREPGLDEVVLAVPHYPADRIVPLVDFCHEHHITFRFVPNIYQTLTTHYDVDALGRIPVVSLRRTALDGWGRVFKRVFDACVAAGALLALSPLLAVIAFAIKWETAGPVFARLQRISRNRPFLLFKFRSMIENAEELKPLLHDRNERADGPLFKIRDDPRITRVGRLLRRTRLDELPQFINALVGDISVVGPRPHQPDEIARYQKHHRKVLAIKAGITGLAQVSGSSELPFEEEVALDTFYIENWSLWMDVRIVLQTALRMFTDRTAA